ncbi:hypothetical protein PHK61_19540 [Actinomycetospora lutea]|uniref:hypothetical protein n=1 Tax=Actinomycetospora lutea TaxID=663604 RepID=UPI0023669055|nr:hypothetical protein [Actinomycetospora lutea]MDD7940622.1 hypothetical protein [Actinomycetospora lutea]
MAVVLGNATQSDVAGYLGGGALVGFLTAISLLPSKCSAANFSLASFMLSRGGRLPRRPLRFLDDAYERGILRRSGMIYQFRHDRFREFLLNPQGAENVSTASAALRPTDAAF